MLLRSTAISTFVVAGLGITCFADTTSGAKPFPDRPHRIPGTIEAEHYDRGPAEVAYHDRDVKNHGADYRGQTQVDIEKRPDASNGHGLGWTLAGEWVQYTVHVSQPGSYRLEFPVASKRQGGVFHVELDGKDVTGPIRVPDTGGWEILKMINATTTHLDTGEQIMRLVMDSNGASQGVGDIDYVRFVLERDSASDDNRLSADERKAGWQLLFNGINHDGWRCNNGQPVATPVADGSLLPYKSGGYVIVHERMFSDFVLKCDVKWGADPCNSGIFFRVSDLVDPVNTGFEVQVHSGDGTTKHDFGAIYDLARPSMNVGRPSGEWNSVEIRCLGAQISVAVNGQQVTTMNCDEFDQPGLCPDGEKHKFKLDGQPLAVRDFARSGYLGFQDHGRKVWYKNVKLLPLKRN